jgi:hypothetical protein
MNETSMKLSHDKTDDDPAATRASTNKEIGTTSQPKHANITSKATSRDYSSRSQRQLN